MNLLRHWYRGTVPTAPASPSKVKAAEFHPSVIETIRVLGGGWYAGTYGAMYRKQPAVRAVVDFLARNVAQLNAKVYERVSDVDRIEVNDHPLAALLRNPNPLTTRYRHMHDTVADLAIYDRAYWLKLRQGRQLAVVRISPAKLAIEFNETTQRRTYRTSTGVEIPRSNLVIFPGYSPDTDDEGVAPLETLRGVLQEEATVRQAREAMHRNAARFSAAVTRPLEAPELSDTAAQRLRADLEAMYGGPSNAGRIALFEEGMTPHQIDQPSDEGYVNSRRLTYEEVAIVYFGPIGGRAWLETAGKASTESNHRQMYQDVLGPWLRYLQDELELQLLPEVQPIGRSTYVEFNLNEKLKGSFEEQGEALTTAVGVPYMTPNEARARVNLPRITDEAYDLPIKPLNVLYGGQPAPTVPTADPGTPEGVAGLSRPSTKALPPAAAVRRRDRATAKHEELLRKYFERQQRAVLSAKAATPDVTRWDRELTADLYLLATLVARETGRLAAEQLDGVYDEQRTLAWLAENARVSAESINATTFEQIEQAEDSDAVRHVFELALGARLAQIALGRSTTLIGFARTEAAKQSQEADGRERTKTWVVTSRRSRHPHMNGETVPVSENFSNGLAWPGDGKGGSADEVAGCHCMLQLSD